MDEKGRGLGAKDLVVDGVLMHIDATGSQIDKIPGDGDSEVLFSMHSQGNSDFFIHLTDMKTFAYIPPLRFIGAYGGPTIGLIQEELALIWRGFLEKRGQLLDLPPVVPGTDRIYRSLGHTVLQGKKEDPFLYKITDIADGRGYGQLAGVMDLELAKSGDVQVTTRLTRVRPAMVSILFKTGENGGKFPIMAQVFGRMTERIASAQRI